MTATVTRPKIAKALMDAAVNSGAVEYTGESMAVSSLRTECYKLRSAARNLGTLSYDGLAFSIAPASEGMMTLTIRSA